MRAYKCTRLISVYYKKKICILSSFVGNGLDVMLNTLAQSPHYASRQNKTERNVGHVSYTEKPGRWNETFWFLNMEYHHFRNRFGSAYQIWLCFQLEPFMKKSYLFDCVCVFVFSENHFFIIVLTYQMFVARSTMLLVSVPWFFIHISFEYVWAGKKHIIPHVHHTTPHHTTPKPMSSASFRTGTER